MTPFDPSILKPADCLLYRPSDLFGWLIARKTVQEVSHVELYDGNGFSVASRDGKGVNRYPLRTAQLAYVLRPNVPVDWQAGQEWFSRVKGDEYDWKAILVFAGMCKDGEEHKEICSEFADKRYRASGFNAVSMRIHPDHVAPAQFLESAVLDELWSDGR